MSFWHSRHAWTGRQLSPHACGWLLADSKSLGKICGASRPTLSTKQSSIDQTNNKHASGKGQGSAVHR